jgi:hypothetical protein
MTDALTTAGIADAVRRIANRIDGIRDRLNAADRILGDGDTGMTIASVVGAWEGPNAREQPDVATLLKELGRETRRATGSSLGSVLSIGMTAASKAATMEPVALLDAATAAIVERSGASPGDKTILDSLLAIRAALANERSAVSAIAAAAQALDDFRPRESKLGRARVYGAKSAGHDDPGMLAAWLLLRAAAGQDQGDSS